MEQSKPKVGQFCWTDLTLDQPETVKEFYKEIFGWKEFPVKMKDGEDEYNDFAMAIDETTPGGGICNNRGTNHGMPAQWITYFNVENIAETIKICLDKGGSIVKENLKKDGTYNYAILKDPMGIIFGVVNV